MTTSFTQAELSRLSTLFFTDLPVRAHQISDAAIRAAVETVTCAAVELGLDVFFPRAWQQLSYMGSMLDKKDKTSIEDILTQRLLSHFVNFTTHARLVNELMVYIIIRCLVMPAWL